MRNIILYVKPDRAVEKKADGNWTDIRMITEDGGQKKRWCHIGFDLKNDNGPEFPFIVVFYTSPKNTKRNDYFRWSGNPRAANSGSYCFKTEEKAMKAARRWIADGKPPKECLDRCYDQSWLEG